MDDATLSITMIGEDHVHARGYMGLTTNKSKGTCFDMFQIQPLEVKEEPELDGTIFSPPFTCSRFKEHYKVSNPDIAWHEKLPAGMKITKGPQKWKYVKRFEGRKFAMC